MARMTTATTVTFLFTDLSGSTEILERLGDDAAQSLWRTHFELLRHAVAAHGGTEVKSLGDGLMVAFPSALSAVAAAVAMQQATNRHNRRESHPPLRVRVGLHAGEPIRTDDDYFGASVVIARRLCDIAASDGIYVSSIVRGLIGNRGGFEFRDLGPLPLKGLSEPVSAVEVLWEPAVDEDEPLVTPATLSDAVTAPVFLTALQSGRRVALVGRESELATLRQRLDAEDGGGGVVLLAGEPGVGKTRLLLEAAEHAQNNGWQVLIGHAYDSEGMPPYLPFEEAISGIVRATPNTKLHAEIVEAAPEIALLIPELRDRVQRAAPRPSLGPEGDRYRLFEGVAQVLGDIARSSPRGLLLCLEDLHWADDSTLSLLEHIARQLADIRVLIAVTYRDTELETSRSLARTLEQIARQGSVLRLDIERLVHEEVGALLAKLGGPEPPASLIEAVYAETEGNPFFVREVFEYLQEEGRLLDTSGRWRVDLHIAESDVPPSVRLVISRRLERVSERCRRTLSLAALIGRSFDYELLRVVSDLGNEALLDALDEAERAHLLESTTAGLTFAHELVRQTLVNSLTQPRRQNIHLRIAQTMEAIYARNLAPYVSELAGHFRLAGNSADANKTIAYCVRAAGAAQALFAYADAVSNLEAALAAQERAQLEDASQKCDLLLQLGEALMPAGEPRRAVEVATQALALAEAPGDSKAGTASDPERGARACRVAIMAMYRYGGSVMWGTPEWAQWAQCADRYAAEGTVDRVYADYALAAFEHNPGRFRAWRAQRERALSLARRLDQADPLFLAAWLFISFDGAPQHQAERRHLVEELAARPKEGVNTRTLCSVLAVGGDTFLGWGDRDRAEALWHQVSDLAARTRDPFARLYSLWGEVAARLLAGEFERAVELGDALESRGADYGMAVMGRVIADSLVWRPRLYLGRFEEALAALGEPGRLAVAPEALYLAAKRVLTLAHLGRAEEARTALGQVVEKLEGALGEEDETPAFMLLYLLEAAVLLEERALVEAFAARLSSLAHLAGTHSHNMTCFGRHLGAAAALLGKPEEARGYYAQALDVATKIRFRPEIALTRLQLAELLLEHYPEERAEALDHLDFAIAEFREMKMAPSLERASAMRSKVLEGT